METTFMTIHNITPEANILYASDSIVDILGYRPDEIIGKSCFEYFHPDEVPIAQKIHGRSVRMDKAAVLHYARIRNREGQWVGCECVFTIVHDVLVSCTSIYRGDLKNERRAADAPAVRRLFASSPRDPRYHMLEHLSAKFRANPQPALREPRAALILNRFTRTLTVMYATDAVQSILGVSSEQFKDKSFYECIQENCLPEAIRCLESAKANDSIAYLRFWYRDPRRPEDLDEDEVMREASQSSDSDEDGGVELHRHMDVNTNLVGEGSSSHQVRETSPSHQSSKEVSGDEHGVPIAASPILHMNDRTSSGESTDLEHHSPHAIFDQPQVSRSSTSSAAAVPEQRGRARTEQVAAPVAPAAEPFEIEAVVSCTSDGLVVVLRRARPVIPSPHQPVAIPRFANGLFAAPWGANPIRPHVFQPNHQFPFQHGFEAPLVPAGGPPMDDLLVSIRDVAVFAWSLAGINGNIATYGRGFPRGEAQPPGGLPIWDPYAQPVQGYAPPSNQAAQRWTYLDQMRTNRPADENKVPFQHLRQEGDFRYHDSYGSDPMGSEPPGYHLPPGALANVTDQAGHFYQGPGSYELNRFNLRGPFQGHRRYQSMNKENQPGNQDPNQGHGSGGGTGGGSGGNMFPRYY